jgi:hypothetical protein
MSLAAGYLNQFRQPSGWFGRLNLKLMNGRHSNSRRLFRRGTSAPWAS